METITKSQAQEFWRDLMGTLYGDPDYKGSGWSVQPEAVAEKMSISVEKAEAFLWRCCRDDLHLTDRQGGGFVV